MTVSSEMKKMSVANAQGLMPSPNPASAMPTGLNRLNRSTGASSATASDEAATLPCSALGADLLRRGRAMGHGQFSRDSLLQTGPNRLLARQAHVAHEHLQRLVVRHAVALLVEQLPLEPLHVVHWHMPNAHPLPEPRLHPRQHLPLHPLAFGAGGGSEEEGIQKSRARTN